MLITILTIYIIGVIVAYGLALGTMQSWFNDARLYSQNRNLSVLFASASWLTILAVIFAQLLVIPDGRLCFQWRRKG